MKKYSDIINENNEYNNNKIVLLIEYKMMNDNWTALTYDSYSSYLFRLTNEEIIEFMNITEFEIKEIEEKVINFIDSNK
jgi:hypothetical protein